MRTLFLFAVCLLTQLATLVAARAGDVAELEILGFTKDGGVFAFEEYGVQDGRAFPMPIATTSTPTTTNSCQGTPIERSARRRERHARGRAPAGPRRKAKRSSAKRELTANRGITAGFNPVTELSADPFRMVVNPRPIFSPVDPPLEFRLDEIGMNDTETLQEPGRDQRLSPAAHRGEGWRPDASAA